MVRIKKQAGYFSSFDETRIYYEVRGEGPPIILCYGIGCLMNHWVHQVKYFASRYQVITFDYRAHHKSEIPQDRNSLTMESFAKDLEALMNHLQIEKAGIWGHSFGAQVLLKTYELFPERFHHLIFINGFVKDPLQGMFGNNLASSFFGLFKEGHALLPDVLRTIWRISVNNPLAIQLSALAGGFNLSLAHLKDIEIYARGLASLDLESFIKVFDAMVNYDGSPILPTIRVPSFVIGGKKDAVTPQKHQKIIHDSIPQSQFLMIPYGSHCTQLDMPDFVNLAIDRFLQDHKFKSRRPS